MEPTRCWHSDANERLVTRTPTDPPDRLPEPEPEPELEPEPEGLPQQQEGPDDEPRRAFVQAVLDGGHPMLDAESELSWLEIWEAMAVADNGVPDKFGAMHNPPMELQGLEVRCDARHIFSSCSPQFGRLIFQSILAHGVGAAPVAVRSVGALW